MQPEGAYNLMGWSFGCHLAHEIATLLQRDTRQVCTLIFMDGYPTGAALPDYKVQQSPKPVRNV